MTNISTFRYLLYHNHEYSFVLVKFVTIYMTTMQCFQQKRQRWTHCVKSGNFIQSFKAEMFRKRTENGVPTENVLTGQ